MRTNDTYKKSEDNREQVRRVRGAKDLATTPVSNPLSRRSFFGSVTVTRQVTSYVRKLHLTGEALDEAPLDMPPQVLTTKAVWWAIPR